MCSVLGLLGFRIQNSGHVIINIPSYHKWCCIEKVRSLCTLVLGMLYDRALGSGSPNRHVVSCSPVDLCWSIVHDTRVS